MKHFLNPDLLAPNVLTFDIDEAVVGGLLPLCRQPVDETRFSQVYPGWKSDICWISANCTETFATFQSAFDALGIAGHVAPYLDLAEQVRLYAGFLVVRSLCREEDYHLDWVLTGNEAFTLITPITANATAFGLLYKRLDGTIGEYEYRRGEAIVFGDHFVHSTKPGRADEPVWLLSFTFGSDKMTHWGRIARTAARQGGLVCRPDGTFETRDRQLNTAY